MSHMPWGNPPRDLPGLHWQQDINNFVDPETPVDERNLPDQTGKVFIVTGGESGIGFNIARILYAKNAKVYIACRNVRRAYSSIRNIKTTYYTHSKGEIVFLHLDLSDLLGIRATAMEFLRREKRLDCLFNNAGVMYAAEGSKTAQGYEEHLGVNCLGPFLLTKFLIPIMEKTAKSFARSELPYPANMAVRVVWTASEAANNTAPTGGVDMNNLDYSKKIERKHKYAVSKAGVILLAKEFTQRYPVKEAGYGVYSVSLDPGICNTNIYRRSPHWRKYLRDLTAGYMLREPSFGAYTTLFAAFSHPVLNGSYVKAYGHHSKARVDIEDAAKPVSEGGTGIGAKFWDWCEEQVAPYLHVEGPSNYSRLELWDYQVTAWTKGNDPATLYYPILEEGGCLHRRKNWPFDTFVVRGGMVFNQHPVTKLYTVATSETFMTGKLW